LPLLGGGLVGGKEVRVMDHKFVSRWERGGRRTPRNCRTMAWSLTSWPENLRFKQREKRTWGKEKKRENECFAKKTARFKKTGNPTLPQQRASALSSARPAN